MTIKEKLSKITTYILSTDFLKMLIEKAGVKYNIDTLVNRGYVSIIKKGERYYNHQIQTFHNPYIIGAAYLDFKESMFGGLDRYNKEGWTTQISNIFTIYNLKVSKEIEIMGITYKFKKVKKEFLYGAYSKKIDTFQIKYMKPERLFLEYIREYIAYDNEFFREIYTTLNAKLLDTYAKRYPIKKVLLKLNQIKNVGKKHS